jgi:hypothetical protein
MNVRWQIATGLVLLQAFLPVVFITMGTTGRAAVAVTWPAICVV